MTGTEIVAIIGGAALGYWLVAVLLPSISGNRFAESELPQDPADDDGPAPWHVVLGVPEDASRTEIIAGYKARISQYHPDKVATMAPEIRELAQNRSKEINAAYDTALKHLS